MKSPEDIFLGMGMIVLHKKAVDAPSAISLLVIGLQKEAPVIAKNDRLQKDYAGQ
jgi:hypothetical protein